MRAVGADEINVFDQTDAPADNVTGRVPPVSAAVNDRKRCLAAMAEQDNRGHGKATIDFPHNGDEFAPRPSAVIKINAKEHETINRPALE